MVYEKKKVLEASAKYEYDDQEESCTVCDRPKSVVYCQKCNYRIPGVRARKLCPQHPKVCDTMDLTKCPGCKGTELLEVGLDKIPCKSKSVPAANAPSQSALKSGFATTNSSGMNSVVAVAAKRVQMSPTAAATAPALVRPECGYGFLQSDVSMSPPPASPEQTSSCSPFNVNAASFQSQTLVFKLAEAEKVNEKKNDSVSLTGCGSTFQFGSPANKTVSADSLQQAGSKARTSRISLPSTKAAQLGKLNGNEMATSPRVLVGSGSSFSQVDGRFPVNGTSAEMPEPVPTFQPSLPISPTTAGEPPIVGNMRCICTRQVRYVLCNNCGYYDGSGNARKFIPCIHHPHRKTGINFCPECGANAEQAMDEGLLDP